MNEREEREARPLLSIPLSPSSSDPSFACGQVMQITLLNKKSKHRPTDRLALLPSTSISRHISLSLSLSPTPLCQWRLSISRQDCICRLSSFDSMHKAGGKAGRKGGRKRGTSVTDLDAPVITRFCCVIDMYVAGSRLLI